MRYRDELDGMTPPNLIAFCVAGSGTGKEAIGKAKAEIMRVCDYPLLCMERSSLSRSFIQKPFTPPSWVLFSR